MAVINVSYIVQMIIKRTKHLIYEVIDGDTFVTP